MANLNSKKVASLYADKQDTSKPLTGNEYRLASIIDSIIDDIDAAVDAVEEDITTLEAAVEALEAPAIAEIEEDIDALEEAVGDEEAGLVADVAALEANDTIQGSSSCTIQEYVQFQ